MKHLALGLAVIGLGGYCGIVFWMITGLPADLPGHAIALGIASASTMMAGILWRLRVIQREKIVLAPDRWPCQDFAPCTEAERRADLLAMGYGRITLEEWQERRRARPSPPRVNSEVKKFVDDVHIAAVSAFNKSYAEMMGVGKYVTVEELSGPQPNTISEYVTGTKLDTTMPSPFKPGDRVRVTYQLSALHKRIGLLVEQICDGSWGGRRAWKVSWGGSSYDVYENDFILARPKKGEVWNVLRCEKCDSKGSMGTQSLFNVYHDWICSDHARERINCGCLYRIGEMS